VPSYRTGTVTAILAERNGLQRVEVDGEKAYVLTQLIGPVGVGDRVVMNTTAVELGLGTGGWHVVHWNLERDSWSEAGGGHEMKLRYTSLQVDAGAAEGAMAEDPRDHTAIPVVACFLHSQVAAVATACKATAPELRLAYVMTDGGALPIAMSDVVARLQHDNLIDTTVTAGHAFGGDREAVNVAHALDVAADHDVVVVGMGPGSLGTGTLRGFSGIEVATVLDTADAMLMQPVIALRYSEADPRSRHRGLSHHTRTVLEMTSADAVLPIPRGESHPEVDHEVVEVDVPDVSGWPFTSMGRTVADDPKFFEYAAAAGVYAAQALVD
jgi:hypothetical protein